MTYLIEKKDQKQLEKWVDSLENTDMHELALYQVMQYFIKKGDYETFNQLPLNFQLAAPHYHRLSHMKQNALRIAEKPGYFWLHALDMDKDFIQKLEIEIKAGNPEKIVKFIKKSHNIQTSNKLWQAVALCLAEEYPEKPEKISNYAEAYLSDFYLEKNNDPYFVMYFYRDTLLEAMKFKDCLVINTLLNVDSFAYTNKENRHFRLSFDKLQELSQKGVYHEGIDTYLKFCEQAFSQDEIKGFYFEVLEFLPTKIQDYLKQGKIDILDKAHWDYTTASIAFKAGDIELFKSVLQAGVDYRQSVVEEDIERGDLINSIKDYRALDFYEVILDYEGVKEAPGMTELLKKENYSFAEALLKREFDFDYQPCFRQAIENHTLTQSGSAQISDLMNFYHKLTLKTTLKETLQEKKPQKRLKV